MFFHQLLELQAEHHKCSHEFLERTITELKEDHSRKGEQRVFLQCPLVCVSVMCITYVCPCVRIEPQMSMSKGKVFGEPLLSHLSVSGREIAVPIQECVHMLLHSAMREEVLSTLILVWHLYQMIYSI